MPQTDNIWIQRTLKELGYYHGNIDGIIGPKHEAAVVAFKKANGLRPRPYMGPLTIRKLKKALGRNKIPETARGGMVEPPWMVEISKFLGLHEVSDNAQLREWLKSDGATLGDPAELPWCGDAAATAIAKTLPKEEFPGDLARNPYWARNFALLGVEVGHVYGAVLVFSRPGGGGHVGFAVGYDEKNNNFRVRGGNQGNMIKDSWIDADRCIAIRWPSTWPEVQQRPLPLMSSDGAILSRNEA